MAYNSTLNELQSRIVAPAHAHLLHVYPVWTCGLTNQQLPKQRLPSCSFFWSRARDTVPHVSRSNRFRWPSVTDGWTDNYHINIMILYPMIIPWRIYSCTSVNHHAAAPCGVCKCKPVSTHPQASGNSRFTMIGWVLFQAGNWGKTRRWHSGPPFVKLHAI